MDQTTSSLPSPRTVLGWIGKRVPDLLVVVVAAAVLGEVYLRTPLGRQPEYQPDEQLGQVYQPSQVGALGTFNADGHRGPETDWSRPAVVAVGDSQAFGQGVADSAVWTERLEVMLRAAGGEVEVVNAAHPGFGPVQQAVRLERVLGRHAVRAILVRVSIENRPFYAPKPEELERLQAETAARQRVRAATKLLPYLARAALQQLPALPGWSTAPKATDGLAFTDAEQGAAMWRDHAAGWERMLELARDAGNVPVVFFVHDPLDLASNQYLEERLRERTAGNDRVHVVRLGSAEWGLSGTAAQKWQQYHDRYTLQHDRHGNAAHHELVAQVLARELAERRVLGASELAAR